jgi:isoleucyl-tRNA synthetase
MPSEKNKNYRDTLNLPQTDFPMRAGAQITEPKILEGWERDDLYHRSIKENQDSDKFVYHDGPPYANGHIHIGHAFGKILRDIVCKSERMFGKRVYFTPGWDCHGLPIEFKVSEEKGWDKTETPVDPLELKKECRAYASGWIEIQREEFKRLGIIADWENPYVTMSPEYEASILQGFAKFVEGGYIERRERTVPWCPSCNTTLAAAEIEHKDRDDNSCYVLFKVEDESAKKIDAAKGLELSFLVWTTTPWTLPLNRGLMLLESAEYAVVKKDENSAFILAKDLVEKVCKKAGINPEVLAVFKGSYFKDVKALHPTEQGRVVPVVYDSMVSLSDGTAVVHTAPGCGPEDYLVGVKNKLEIYSPISEKGLYTEGVFPAELKGMHVFKGQAWMLEYLEKSGALFLKETLNHSYPYCWRCHKPLIFRATKQWFCNLDKNDLVRKSLEEIDNISFSPEWGKTRLQAFVGTRTEWCISRQRQWGVPITALKCGDCKESAHLTKELVLSVAENVAKDGIEYWDTVSVDQLKKDGAIPADLKCEKCSGSNFVKEQDILDVWFDSGVSNFAVLAKDPAQGVPADLYLEGSDQHRGWFQSSLFASMIINGHTPTKAILTHGFVVDKNRRKMSKSVGNVVAPDEIIKKYSVDVLRLWTATADYETDIAISEQIISTTFEAYRKIRNTCKFMLSNLYDFDEAINCVPSKAACAPAPYNGKFDGFEVVEPDGKQKEISLTTVDRMILGKLVTISRDIKKAYKEHQFSLIFNRLNTFCVNDLSAEYLDIVKDRLYVEAQSGNIRRSAQMTIDIILGTITRLMAPILSFLAEEVSNHHHKKIEGCEIENISSIHLQTFVDENEIEELVNAWDAEFVGGTPHKKHDISKFWSSLENLRAQVFKAIETKRETGEIKHSLESCVSIFIDEKDENGKRLLDLLPGFEKFEGQNRFLTDWLIVSDLKIVESPDGLEKTGLDWLSVSAKHAAGTKCPRCWHWEETDCPDDLCTRCKELLS